MSARELMITALSKEILGPRNGCFEEIKTDPKGEYLVGVLEPKEYSRGDLAFYTRSDLQTVEAAEGEDDDIEEETEFGAFGLHLDPRALAKSLGISFVLSGKKPRVVGLCATWARYEETRKKVWKRKPYKFISHRIEVSNERELYKDNGIRITVRTKKTSQGDYHVSVFLVNETSLEGKEYPRTEDFIFQPQLRIVCEDEAMLVPIIGELHDEPEEAGLSLLYRERKAFARGHLCSATWKDVDPERPQGGCKSTPPERRSIGHPFVWIDDESVEEPDRTLFTNPDVRTEYLPCYPIQQVIMEPRRGAEELEKMDAGFLAELWEQSDFARVLRPISRIYDSWIQDQEKETAGLPDHLKETARRHIDSCRESSKRIKEGISVVENNDDARLAFCFMNKVMHLQSVWNVRTRKTGEPLIWRLFQIAFILQCIPSLCRLDHIDRQVCDLLWFPTAGGKTEAYLGLSMFLLGFRRRRDHGKGKTGAGTCVLSRYTLRMLTIQQFRRALVAVTACEYLRTIDWRPKGCKDLEKNLWGTSRFSIGLWVGQEVTPNRLVDHKGYSQLDHRQVRYPGAVSTLVGLEVYSGSRFRVKRLTESEPAQVTNCPVCNAILSVPTETVLPPGEYKIHFIVSSPVLPKPNKDAMNGPGFNVRECTVGNLPDPEFYVISVKFFSNQNFGAESLDKWWKNFIAKAIGPDCRSEFARASRPGYFIRRWGVEQEAMDFEIHCPNPECELNQTSWSEKVFTSSGLIDASPNLRPFRVPGNDGIGHGIPIPAYVVDDQLYHRCPSLIISTVDKFARLPYEPRAAALFGNVTKFDKCWGFCRAEAPPDTGGLPRGEEYDVPRFDAPELIIQDELHLIEGPLGSMVGVYEAAIEALSSGFRDGLPVRPKYVASSATIRHVASQVLATFDRRISIFPPPGISVEDNFFSHTREAHQLESIPAGRLYVGVCAPGHGPHTPTIRMWSSLLRQAYELRLSRGSNDKEADQFWTVVGYFNAIRELAMAEGLFRADVKERLRQVGGRVRTLEVDLELSSRMRGSEIPAALAQLSKFPDNIVDAVFSTSMFGTGVDIDRLGLMIVHGQPKTTANYIQATGRVGREKGGLVIAFLRSTRPRDLDHYEFFVGYHRCLSRYVEPITVHPFSPRARERALGPIAVALLRNAVTISGIPVSQDWAPEDLYAKSGGIVATSGSRKMKTDRNSQEVNSVIDLIERRSQIQPSGCRPQSGLCRIEIASDLDKWNAAARALGSLIYYEPTMIRGPQNPVVLGDPQHEVRGLVTVFRNAPQSLRDVESTTTFEG
jgi:DNA polymerase IIIc chi subunit